MSEALFVDLASGEIWRVPLNGLVRSYLGGRGCAARYMWDLVPSEPESPLSEAPIIFSPGLLTGSELPDAGGAVIVCRSPLNGLYQIGAAPTSLGLVLKRSGCGVLVVLGASEKLVYVSIEDEEADIREASAEWDEASRYRGREADSSPGVATVTGDGLIGAVMRSKNLRGLAVHASLEGAIPGNDRLAAVLTRVSSARGRIPPGASRKNEWTGSPGGPGEAGRTVAESAARAEEWMAVADCLGLGRPDSYLLTSFAPGLPKPYASVPALVAELFSAAVGLDTSEEDLLTMGRRVITLEKCFNVRSGATRADDTMPRQLIERLRHDQAAARGEGEVQPKPIEALMDEYYRLRGWEPLTGFPTRSALERLDLIEVADALEKLGLLGADGAPPDR